MKLWEIKLKSIKQNNLAAAEINKVKKNSKIKLLPCNAQKKASFLYDVKVNK